MISFWILLFIVVTGWIISGSLVPLISAVAGLLLLGLLLLVRFPLSRILVATGVLLLMTMQAFAFQNGYAGLIYEDLPVSFHAGMGCYLWATMVIMLKDGSRKQVGGWVFYLSLAGGVLLFAAAASVEIFRFSPFLVRCLATLPLAITLLQEFCRHSPVLSCGGIVAICFATPLLGALCHVSRPMSAWLKSAIEIKDKIVYDFTENDGSGTRGRVDLSGGDGVVTLARRASISVDKDTRFFLKLNSIEDFLAITRRPLYLRTSTVAIFDGNDKILPVRKGKWLLDMDDGVSDQITTLPERSRSPGRSLEYAIVLPKSDSSLIPLIEGTNRIRADEIFHFSEGRYQLGQDAGTAEWMRFSAIGAADERPGQMIPKTGGSPGDLHLALPNTDLIRQIRTLTAQITSGKTPHLAISDYIKNQCRYSLEYKNPKNLSPVENLLFAEKKGHCELFATATVMMLRSAGIPSRIAYGYTGGASNREQLAIAFRGIDIHAWAEILNQNGEWRIFDTTPPDRGATRIATASVSGKIDWKMAAYDPAAAIRLADNESVYQSSFAAAMAALSDWAGAHFILLTGGLLLFGLLARWTGARWFGKKSNGSGEHAPAFDWQLRHKALRPDFVKEILALGERAGITRQPGTTLREFVKTLREKGISSEPVTAEIYRAVEYYYHIRYGGGEVDEGFERSVSRMIRALKVLE